MAERLAGDMRTTRPRAARAGRALRLALVLVASLGGCSILVDGTLGDVHCRDEGAIGAPDCPADSTCVRGLCVETSAHNASLGKPCSGDGECGPGGLCLDPASFGAEGSPFCTQPCCSSSDCDDPALDLVCWASGHGGARFCRPAAALGRPRVGAGANGAPCDDAAACRSGLCDGVRCVDTCCSDTNCAAGSVSATCQLSGGERSWVCAAPPPPGKAQLLEPCAADADCATGLCLPILGALRCSMPCCDSAACGTVADGADVRPLACTDVPHEGALVRACAKVLPQAAMGAVGTECATNDECRSGVCADEGGKRVCTDACCTDANCADPAFACRPHVDGSAWALRCERK